MYVLININKCIICIVVFIKILWIIIILVLPVLGLIIWFFAGPGKKK